MIIKTKKFKEVCSTILSAIDTSEISILTETLELESKNKALKLSVTNGEYFVTVNFNLDNEEELHASVNANLFLKLINAVTTEDIQLSMKDSYLEVKANGTYKIPYIYEGDHTLILPQIKIQNPTLEMKVSGDILKSIQKMYYLDEKGCLTSLLNSVPVNAIRGRTEFDYPYNIVLNTVELKSAIDRLMLFSTGYGSIKNLKPYSLFEFKNNKVTIFDSNKDNVEEIYFKNDEILWEKYSMVLDLTILKLILDTVSDDYITLSFGNHQAMVVKRKFVYNVVPECNYNIVPECKIK